MKERIEERKDQLSVEMENYVVREQPSLEERMKGSVSHEMHEERSQINKSQIRYLEKYQHLEKHYVNTRRCIFRKNKIALTLV